MSKSDRGGLSAIIKSTSYTRRDLMLPDEVRRLKETQELVFKEATRPILACKIRYYSDKVFAAGRIPPVTVPPLDLERIPPRQFDIPNRKRRVFGEPAPEDGIEQEAAADDEAQVSKILAPGGELQKLLDEEASDSPAAAAAGHDLRAQLVALTERG